MDTHIHHTHAHIYPPVTLTWSELLIISEPLFKFLSRVINLDYITRNNNLMLYRKDWKLVEANEPLCRVYEIYRINKRQIKIRNEWKLSHLTQTIVLNKQLISIARVRRSFPIILFSSIVRDNHLSSFYFRQRGSFLSHN